MIVPGATSAIARVRENYGLGKYTKEKGPTPFRVFYLFQRSLHFCIEDNLNVQIDWQISLSMLRRVSIADDCGQ